MIPMKYKGSDLIGKKCRPTHNIRNGAGDGITPKAVCTIVDVVRGHGFTIQTETCSRCGQYAYIRKVKREELELVEKTDTATSSGWFSVKDRLPEPDTKVLVYGRNEYGVYCITCLYSAHRKWLYHNRTTADGETITHWMPLPEPPKEE